MPELPEVETVRRGIESRVVGRRIGEVTVGRERSVRRVGREAVITGLTGVTVVSADRRGKYLLCDLDTGDRMMIHLRMSGRVIVAPHGAERPPHTHVVLPLAPRDGTREELWFVDPRTFGEVVVYDPAEEDEVIPELARLGVDPIRDPFDADVLRAALRGRRGALKPLLLGQHVVAGIGNIYRTEVLWRCGVHPSIPGHRLPDGDFARIWEDSCRLLARGVELGAIVTVDGAGPADGRYRERTNIFGKSECPRCEGRVRRMVIAGRKAYACPSCQPRRRPATRKVRAGA